MRQPAATRPPGSMTCAEWASVRDQANRQQHEPDAQHDAPQSGRQAHADEAVAQASAPCHPGAGFQQIAQAEELQHRQGGERRQTDHQHRDAEQPFQH